MEPRRAPIDASMTLSPDTVPGRLIMMPSDIEERRAWRQETKCSLNCRDGEVEIRKVGIECYGAISPFFGQRLAAALQQALSVQPHSHLEVIPGVLVAVILEPTSERFASLRERPKPHKFKSVVTRGRWRHAVTGCKFINKGNAEQWY